MIEDKLKLNLTRGIPMDYIMIAKNAIFGIAGNVASAKKEVAA